MLKKLPSQISKYTMNIFENNGLHFAQNIMCEKVLHSRVLILFPGKVGTYEHSIEMCMISAALRVTETQPRFTVPHISRVSAVYQE